MDIVVRERGRPASGKGDDGFTRRHVLRLITLGLAAAAPRFATAAGTEAQLTWGVHVSLAPIWFDPADVSGIITPFMLLNALHDAMASLAESWSASEDGLTFDFVLRGGATFHNGDPVTADDVKFSFERYRGTSYGLLKDRVASVDIPDPLHVRFKLKQPWPDFLTFYASATAAGWVVPRKYVEKVGDEGFKKAPVGAGPYKFVSFNPGVELVLEAFEQYWRKPPSVKRLVFKVIPDETTRLAALKRGEVDIAYSIRGELAGELQHTPGLALKPAVVQGTFCLYFPDQWDPKSPWHDERVRRAASLANRSAGHQRRADPWSFFDKRHCAGAWVIMTCSVAASFAAVSAPVCACAGETMQSASKVERSIGGTILARLGTAFSAPSHLAGIDCQVLYG
jgi:peptide/nickel transport system substrate-binding protein